ncbi:MAG: acyl-CoA dehydratase activase-related protein [Bacilli bacterium]|nr:acyl-CoA dehydratase activase-related protein [Bacilli bacterium]
MEKLIHIGLDLGSTTAKIVIIDNLNNILYSAYQRHFSDFKKTIKEMLAKALENYLDYEVTINITGSGGFGITHSLGLKFIQEVIACNKAVEAFLGEVDVIIELGGEDAKITFFSNGIEQRMNGTCAGGTGAFIDQMASLLNTDALGLNEYAKKMKNIHPIAARCGVFAKSDVQPLLNEGASKADISASIFQAVVNQTISGLACGRKIKGKVVFLGGPLSFLSELRKRFVLTLGLTEETAIFPKNAELFVALGASIASKETEKISVIELLNKISSLEYSDALNNTSLPPIFNNIEEYKSFKTRHNINVCNKADLYSYEGNVFLGIDCGSTTTKMALIDEQGNLLYQFYQSNQGNPLRIIKNALLDLYGRLPEKVKIVASAVTGYGEKLIKAAFSVDIGEIETVAHYKAAEYFIPEVDFILDIGGQDMKCITIKNKVISSVVLNEACSAGCGSFLESFAHTLNISLDDFVKEALFAKNPVDLGSRCTVFMNSKVKQAQKEGALLGDIASGLSYSIIKNALYKVIKIKSATDLGNHIIVQGGTFYNDAVLRTFEKITKKEVTRLDIAGLMGAFGCALIAKSQYKESFNTKLLNKEALLNFTHTTEVSRCMQCSNNCVLNINTFSNGERLITGNRCERGAGVNITENKIPNLYEYKYKRLFSYKPLDKDIALRGSVGLPRVLNFYENYPFWFTFFTTLKYRVELSPRSSKKIYESGMDTIASESLCYPAKLVHGHIISLIEKQVDFIFYPAIVYEGKEDINAINQYNCPIVTSYSEAIKNNVDELKENNVKFINPFISFKDKKEVELKLIEVFSEIDKKEIKNAIRLAYKELTNYKLDIRRKGEEALKEIKERNLKAIVLAGRPYHIDPEINPGIDKLITSYQMAVLSEDSIAHLGLVKRPIRVVDQWVYHSRLYRASEFVSKMKNIELIQLNSFGCGLDAVTSDQVKDILEKNNKIYTCLKIDEVSNLGAARIRIRSLKAAMAEREKHDIEIGVKDTSYIRSLFTKSMKTKHTILAPQMSPIHFRLMDKAFQTEGYNLVVLEKVTKEDIEEGLKYVNNDACFPSIMIVGQIVNALKSGKYDLNKTSVTITQTGGGCRATNYIGFLRKAFEDLGFSHVPVISLSLGVEKNPGFKFTFKMAKKVMYSLFLGDLLMRVLYRIRPYEAESGSSNKLYEELSKKAAKVVASANFKEYVSLSKEIIYKFDNLPLRDVILPRVGLVGEILVKFHPDANNHLVEYLESEGAEVVMPDLADFFFYVAKNIEIQAEELYVYRKRKKYARMAINIFNKNREYISTLLKESKRFTPPIHIDKIAEGAKKILSLCNQTGEGWFLTGEMIELLESGVSNIICMQPFACLPNHIVGKSMIKELRNKYPKSNIVAVDYDPGASEVNQINRIKLMLSVALSNMKK